MGIRRNTRTNIRIYPFTTPHEGLRLGAQRPRRVEAPLSHKMRLLKTITLRVLAGIMNGVLLIAGRAISLAALKYIFNRIGKNAITSTGSSTGLGLTVT